MSLFRKTQWARGVRIEVFFDQLLKQAARAGLSKRAACAALVGELPQETQSMIKAWIKGKEECTEKETREFVTLGQATLLQKGIGLEHGARLDIMADIRAVEDGIPLLQVKDEEKSEEEVHQVRSQGKQRAGTAFQRASSKQTTKCYTCVARWVIFGDIVLKEPAASAAAVDTAYISADSTKRWNLRVQNRYSIWKARNN